MLAPHPLTPHCCEPGALIALRLCPSSEITTYCYITLSNPPWRFLDLALSHG